MKLVSVHHASAIRTGVLLDGDTIFIPSLAPEGLLNKAAQLPVDLKSILTVAEGLALLQRVTDTTLSFDASQLEQLRNHQALLEISNADFAAVIPDPMHIINCGAMYRQHIKEMGDLPVPEHPAFFQSSNASLTGHGKSIVLPTGQPDQVDYEGELAIIMGQTCYAAVPDEAIKCVAGYSIVNDISARDHVSEVMAAEATLDVINAWGRNTAGKQHPTFTPIGPCLVTCDEIPDVGDLDLTTRLNGETMQQVNTSDMVFNVGEIVAYISQWFALQPGDIIATGSPAGVGVARDPQVFMKPGDVVEVSISNLGTLTNNIVSAVD